MALAVQSPPKEDEDVRIALERAIKSKKQRRQSNETARNFCLVLLNALDLNVGTQSNVWEEMALTSFDAVVLVNGYSQPSVELISGRLLPASG